MGGNKSKLISAIKTDSNKEIMQAFNAYDKDKSGRLEPDEAVKFGKDAVKVLGKSPDPDVRAMVAGLDGEGFIRQWVDTSGDGNLTWREFQVWIGTLEQAEMHKKVDESASSESE